MTQADDSSPYKHWDALPDSPGTVTIFGAGVAGLTAAHELVERGFRVQVWEPDPDPRFPQRGCEVGGLARTQWGAIPWGEGRKVDRSTTDSADPVFGSEAAPSQTPESEDWFVGKQTHPVTIIPYKFYFRWSPGRFRRVGEVTTEDLNLAQVVRLVEAELKKVRWAYLRLELRAHRATQLSAEVCGERIRTCIANSMFGALKFEQQAQARWSASGNVARKQVKVDVCLVEGPESDTAQIRLELHGTAGLRVLDFERVWACEDDPHDSPGGIDEDFEALVTRIEAASHVEYWYAEAATHSQSGDKAEYERRVLAVRRLLETLAKNFNARGKARGDKLTFEKVKGNQAGCHEFEVELHRKGQRSASTKLAIVPIGRMPYPVYAPAPDDISMVLSFRPRERWIPGEHGYRFFPSFYRHLFDTMKRTPILDVEPKPVFQQAQEAAVGVYSPEPLQYVETDRTVFDNLHPTCSHVLAFADGQRAPQFSRMPVQSLEELRQYLLVTFGKRANGGFGLNGRDVTRLTLKLLQFATSCEARRQTYEELSWWDYIGADGFSESARDFLLKWPEALVAMDAKECDARTQWVPFIQLLLDQVRPDAYRDGTLRGPTSEAWLNPWRRYLEAQGVEFIRGRLDGFKFLSSHDGTKFRVWPSVTCYDPRHPCNDEGEPGIHPGYFLIAVSTLEARRLGQAWQELDLPERAPEGISDLARASDLGGLPADAARVLEESRPPNCDLRHFAGLQFYFEEDVYWIDGHVYFPESPWSLTAVSQARFWQDRADWEHGYRGVLSSIVGTWDNPGLKAPYPPHERDTASAWRTPPSALAREAWEQIRSSLENRSSDGPGRFARRSPQQALPFPTFWHLDQNLKWNEDAGRYENSTPFFIARPKRFKTRPGRLGSDGYTIEHGFLMAGHHMQTYTRLPSMEAANESARHAVNAILRHQRETNAGEAAALHGSTCDVWNPEDRELEDLQFMKDLDEKLFARELPHVMEIFDLDHLAANLLRGGAQDPMDPLLFLARLRRLYRPVAAQ